MQKEGVLEELGCSGDKYIELNSDTGQPTLSLPAVSGRLDRLETFSLLVASGNEQLSGTVKFFDQAGSVAYEAPLIIEKINLGKSLWGYATVPLHDFVKNTKGFTSLTPQVCFKTSPGIPVFIDRVALSRNLAPQKVLLGAATTSSGLIFSNLPGTEYIPISIKPGGTFSLNIETLEYAPMFLKGMVSINGVQVSNPGLEVGTWNSPLKIDGYQYTGIDDEVLSVVKVDDSVKRLGVRFLQTGTPESPWEITCLTPTLFWTNIPGADKYFLEIYQDIGGKGSLLAREEVRSNSFQVPARYGLMPGVSYHAQVTPVRNDGVFVALPDCPGQPVQALYFKVSGQSPYSGSFENSGITRNRNIFGDVQQCYVAEILTLADGLHDQNDIFEAINALGSTWINSYQKVLDFIESYGYKFKSMEEFDPSDKDKKIVYLWHDVHNETTPNEIAPAYQMLAVTYARKIPVVAYLSWEGNRLSPFHVRDYLNMRKIADGKLIRYALHANPVATYWRSILKNEEKLKETFLEAVSAFMQNQKSFAGTYEEIITQAETLYLRQVISFNKYFPGSKTVSPHGDGAINKEVIELRGSMSDAQLAEKPGGGISYREGIELLSGVNFFKDFERLSRYEQSPPIAISYISDVIRVDRLRQFLEQGKMIFLLMHPCVIEREGGDILSTQAHILP